MNMEWSLWNNSSLQPTNKPSLEDRMISLHEETEHASLAHQEDFLHVLQFCCTLVGNPRKRSPYRT